MKFAAQMASLRALASMGLPAELFIPAALEMMHGIIPSLRNLFDWTDAQGNLIRYYFEGPIDPRIAAHYFEEFHNRREGDVMPTFRQAVTGRSVSMLTVIALRVNSNGRIGYLRLLVVYYY